MTPCYVAFGPTCYTPPSLSGFKSFDRDKLGTHEIFQQSQYHLIHSFFTADAAHVGGLHCACLSVYGLLDTFPVHRDQRYTLASDREAAPSLVQPVTMGVPSP